VFALAVALVACGSDDDNNNNSSSSNNENNTAENDGNDGDSSGDIELGQKDLTISLVAWAGEQARTPIVAQLLEKAGYNVEQTVLEAGPMWQAVADGGADFTTAAWLPATHNEYWEKYSDNVDKFA